MLGIWIARDGMMLMKFLLQLARNLSHRSQEGNIRCNRQSQAVLFERFPSNKNKAGSPTHSQDFWSQAGSLFNDDECAVQLVLM